MLGGTLRGARLGRLGMGSVLAASALVATALAGGAAGGSSRQEAKPHKGLPPITIGVSVQTTGDFSSDGVPTEQGYELWADVVNAHGGLLGRKVDFTFVNDNSDPTQTVTNYTNLITNDHVDLVFGPFSSLLTAPAEVVVHRYGYAFPEPSGGAPAVFTHGFDNLFFVQPAAILDNMLPFVHWIISLPKSERPKTAAYVTSDNPFTYPQIDLARSMLQKAGVKTVYQTEYQSGLTDYSPEALRVAASHAQLFMLGTTALAANADYIHNFITQHYNPKFFISSSGPDQGSQFSSLVGVKNTTGIFVPGSWSYNEHTPGNAAFVAAFVKRFGGRPSQVPGDAAESYSVGEVVQQAIEKTHSVSNAKLIVALHSGTYQTVQGPMRWNSIGEPSGKEFLIQWVNGTPQIVYPAALASHAPLVSKPVWGSSLG